MSAFLSCLGLVDGILSLYLSKTLQHKTISGAEDRDVLLENASALIAIFQSSVLDTILLFLKLHAGLSFLKSHPGEVNT